MPKKLMILFSLILVLALVGCGGKGPPVEVKNGQALFEQTIIGGGPGCNTCHSLRANQVLVGPSLAGVATRAEKRVPGIFPDDYLRQSILEPDSYIVSPFEVGVMPKNYASELKPEQLQYLVAYLMTLK